MSQALALVVDHSEVVDVSGLKPQHDLDSEASVIGACILDPSALPRVIGLLLPKHFYSEAHARIFEAILSLREKGSPIDTVIVARELNATDRLVQAGGAAYLSEVLNVTPALFNVRTHAEIVYDCWRVREIARLSQLIAARGYHGVDNVQDYADKAAKAITTIARAQPNVSMVSHATLLDRRMMEMHAAANITADNEPREHLLPFGIPALDKLLGGGMKPGGKTSVIALGGVGKTVTAIQACISAAESGIGAAMFELEMNEDDTTDRVLSCQALVDNQRISKQRFRPTLNADEWSRMAALSKRRDQRPLPFYLDASGGLTAEDVCSRARLFAEQSMVTDGVALGLVAVDFLQHLKPSPGLENEKKNVCNAHATKLFSELAKELGIVVLELAQRKDAKPDYKTGKRPRPAHGDCFWGQEAEQLSSTVIYLHRDDDRNKKFVDAYVTKGRFGQDGCAQLELQGAFSRFIDRHDPMLPASRQYVAKHYYEDEDR